MGVLGVCWRDKGWLSVVPGRRAVYIKNPERISCHGPRLGWWPGAREGSPWWLRKNRGPYPTAGLVVQTTTRMRKLELSVKVIRL